MTLMGRGTSTHSVKEKKSKIIVSTHSVKEKKSKIIVWVEKRVSLSGAINFKIKSLDEKHPRRFCLVSF